MKPVTALTASPLLALKIRFPSGSVGSIPTVGTTPRLSLRVIPFSGKTTHPGIGTIAVPSRSQTERIRRLATRCRCAYVRRP